jgi:fibronectin-binding autotransporter adhesin
VASGAALQLSSGTGFTTAANVPLTLSGTGIGTNTGALENVTGNNTYTGPITLSGGATIGSDAGLLTLNSATAIGGSGDLTLSGAGNGAIASVIGIGSGNVIMSGTGTWTFSGANTYTGSTTVNSGTLAYSSTSLLQSGTVLNLGSGTGLADLTFGGAGGTISNAISFNGSGSIELGNSGSAAITYSATPTYGTAGGNRTIILGNATDTAGGSIGNIANPTGFTTTLSKTGAMNSTWILTGTNTYTGGTNINGGVLQIASASALPSTGTLALNGTSTSYAILQTNGTLNLTTASGTGPTNLVWGANAGFSAINGTLNLNINNGAALSWGTNFVGAGASTLAFGSTTSNSQVILPNAINLASTDQFQRPIYVEKGVGGDSALLSGILSNGPGTGAASGLLKLGAGTLILSNGGNNYAGWTSVVGGTLVAEANSAVDGSTNTATSTGVFGSGYGPTSAPSTTSYSVIYLGTTVGNPNVTTGGVVNPTVMIGGNYTVANPVTAFWTNGTGQTYGVGGYLDANSTFSGKISLSGTAATGNSFAVTQVATTGTDALNLTGGIAASGTPTGTSTVKFANVGAVNVTTTGISNGTGTLAVAQTGPGTTTLAAANTYTGGTTVSGGTINLTGTTSATGLFAVGGVSGGLATANLSGTGTVGGALTTSSANGNVAHLAPGANTSGNFASAGTLTVAGALTIGSGTALDIDLGTATTVGSGANDLIAMTGTGANGLLTIGGTITVNFNALGTLALGTPTSNDYTLISGAASTSGLLASNFTMGTINGSTDTAHFIVTGNNLQVYFTGVSAAATQSFTSPTPSTLRIMAGATTTVGATLNNTAASGSNALNVALSNSSTGGVGTVSGLTSSSGATVAAGSSSAVGGTFTAAGTGGTGSYGITNTDANATNPTASTGGTVTVYTKSTPTLSTSTVNLGLIHQGATVANQTTNLQNAAGTYVAGLQVTSTGGLTNTGGQTLIAAGGSDTLTASVSTSTVGNLNQTYTIQTGDDATITGASANANQTYSITGQVFSGQMIWNGASGGVWGTNANWNDSQNSSIHAAPGTTAGFANTDTATFDTTGAGGTVNLASGVNPSLKAITFNDATSYTIAPGTGGSLALNGTGSGVGTGGNNALVTVTTGSHTISAPVSLTTSANVAVASGQQITFSGAVSGSGTGLALTGAGTTALTNATGNSYTGGTSVTAGKLFINNTSGSATGTGAVTVSGSGTVLKGRGEIDGAVSLSSGANLYSGSTATGTGVGSGMTLTSTLAVSSSSLTFQLNNGVTTATYANPNTTTSFLNLGTTGSISFSGTDAINLVDLTNGNLMTLRMNATPYLLISAASDAMFNNLVTMNSTGQLALDGNGTVLGVWQGGALTNYTALTINQFGSDGVTPLAHATTADPGYYAPSLYLINGDLEVVPEPSTWALMIGGLALLVMIQSRRNIQR